MLIPLVILAVLAAVAGFANIDDGFGKLVEGWLPTETEELVTQGGFQLWIALASGVVGLAGLGVAWLVYGLRLVSAERVAVHRGAAAGDPREQVLPRLAV